MLHIFIDADACPVKQEVYRVADRYGLNVTLVANSWLRIPSDETVTLKVVNSDFDAADDWIVKQVQCDDIVITADIPLANRCMTLGARAIRPTGKPFTEDNIGETVAIRDLMSELRSSGIITGGPPPIQKLDRSLFAQQLDIVIQSILRRQRSAENHRPNGPLST